MKFQDTPPTSYRESNRFNKALGEHLGKWTLYKTYDSPNTAYTVAWSVRKTVSAGQNQTGHTRHAHATP